MSLMCKGSFPIIKDKNPFSTANYMKIHIIMMKKITSVTHVEGHYLNQEA